MDAGVSFAPVRLKETQPRLPISRTRTLTMADANTPQPLDPHDLLKWLTALRRAMQAGCPTLSFAAQPVMATTPSSGQ